jgi:two-component system chemotaxis sensor kinase CheA
MDALEQTRQIFFSESSDLLQQFEDSLLVLNLQAVDEATVNDLFRAMHTIKGSAGLVAFDHVVHFTHGVETLLDRFRKHELDWTRESLNLLLDCQDHISRLIRQEQPDAETDTSELDARESTLNARLAKLGGGSSAHQGAPQTAKGAPACAEEAQACPRVECWAISARFSPGILASGLDVLSMLEYLGTLGELRHVELTVGDVPRLSELEPTRCYLGFDAALKTQADKPTLDSVFEFVRHDGTIHLIAPASKQADYLDAIRSLPAGDCRLGELLVNVGAITRQELHAALVEQHRILVEDQTGEPPKLGQVLVNQGSVAENLVQAALDRQGRERKAPVTGFIKVPADKLDRLIGLVGELVVAGAGAGLLASTQRNPAFIEATSVIQQLVEEIRGTALSLRMVQIGETFNRFNRVVWDVSQQLGKSIRLEIEGAETELDKTVVEKISDPLTHIVRNAMDHGIESPEERARIGKPAEATLKLSARHDSGSILIEVSDDGSGIRLDRVRQKAIESGLIAADASHSRQELLNLLFMPGFSTAKRVSDLSGRGVGMDVVRQNVEALRGTVHVDTLDGEGTTVAIRVPLTLAIIDGFLVKVGASKYIIPLDVVVECIELKADQGSADCGSLNLRGEVLPFVQLRHAFALKTPPPSTQSIVVVRHGSLRTGLVVDTLLGELQTVIKPLPVVFGALSGIAGSSIIGGGEVALIIDVPSLVERAARKSCRDESEPTPVVHRPAAAM